MARIPIATPGGPELSINFPRPVPKGAMIANLGAQGLEANKQLEGLLFKDRERRDYNEQLIAAQNAVNTRMAEAARSNDPRTMLENFNIGIEEDFSTIRANITNPNLQSDFDLRVNSGLNVARTKVLSDQLSLERQESRAQIAEAAEGLIESVAQDTSNENLTLVRDKIQDLTDQGLETGAFTATQAKQVNKGVVKEIETLAVQALVKADKHQEAMDRLEAGDFRSFSPTRIPKMVAEIRKDMQNDNHQDLWYILEDGGASYQLGEQIKEMDANEQLSHSQARDLYAKNQDDINRMLGELVDTSRVEARINREPGATLGPADQKAVDFYGKNALDPFIAIQEQEAAEAGTPWPPERKIEIMNDYVSRMNGMIPKAWKQRAEASILSMDATPNEAVAYSRMFDIANKRDPTVMAKLDKAGQGIGNRARLINSNREQGLSNRENIDNVLKRELHAQSREKVEYAERFDTMIAGDPNLVRDTLGERLLNLDFTLKNGVSVQDYVTNIGFREGGLFKKTTGFPKGTDLATLEQEAEAGGKPVPELLRLVEDDALPEGFSTVEGRTLFTRPTVDFINKIRNFGEGDKSSMEIPSTMIREFQDHLRFAYIDNGGDLAAAAVYASDHMLLSWHPTQYEGAPRWARGTIEQHYEPVNGNWDWTKKQMADALNDDLLEQVMAYEAVGGERPVWQEGEPYDVFKNRVWEFLAWAAQDDPNAAISRAEIPAGAWEEGGRWLQRLERTNLQNFPYPFAGEQDWEESVGYTAFTTQESIEFINPETGRPAPARYPMYEGTDGAYHSVDDLVGGRMQQSAFFYDVRKDPDWQRNQRKEALKYAQVIISKMIQMGAGQDDIQNKIREVAAEYMDSRPEFATALAKTFLSKTVRLYDAVEAGSFREPGGLPGEFITDRFVAEAPKYDHKARKELTDAERRIRLETANARRTQ